MKKNRRSPRMDRNPAAAAAGRIRISGAIRSGPGALATDAVQFHRAIRHGDAEGGTEGSFHQVDVAAMGADQLRGNGQP